MVLTGKLWRVAFSIGQAVLYGTLSRFVDDEEYGVASGRELILKVFE